MPCRKLTSRRVASTIRVADDDAVAENGKEAKVAIAIEVQQKLIERNRDSFVEVEKIDKPAK